MFDPTNSMNRKQVLGFDPQVEPLGQEVAQTRRDGSLPPLSVTIAATQFGVLVPAHYAASVDIIGGGTFQTAAGIKSYAELIEAARMADRGMVELGYGEVSFVDPDVHQHMHVLFSHPGETPAEFDERRKATVEGRISSTEATERLNTEKREPAPEDDLSF